MTLEPHLTVFDGLKDLEEEGNTSAVGSFAYPSADAAFDTACLLIESINFIFEVHFLLSSSLVVHIGGSKVA